MKNALTGITGDVSGFDLAATTDTLIYTCPVAKKGVVTVRFCNRNATVVSVRLYRNTGGTPLAIGALDYDVPVNGNDILEETGIVVSASDVIFVRASATGVTCTIAGFEE